MKTVTICMIWCMIRWNKSFLCNLSQIRNKTHSLNPLWLKPAHFGLLMTVLNVLLQPLLYFNVLSGMSMAYEYSSIWRPVIGTLMTFMTRPIDLIPVFKTLLYDSNQQGRTLPSTPYPRGLPQYRTGTSSLRIKPGTSAMGDVFQQDLSCRDV